MNTTVICSFLLLLISFRLSISDRRQTDDQEVLNLEQVSKGRKLMLYYTVLMPKRTAA